MVKVGDVDALVVAHVSGVGLTAAAEASGMSKSSAWRRLQEPEVQQLVAEVKASRRASVIGWAQSVRSLADLVTEAVVGVLDDDPSHPTIVRLASVVLPEVRHLTESVELGARLDELEARLLDPDTDRDGLAAVVGL